MLRDNNPKKVIMHHSATKDGKTLNDFKSICKYHTEVKKWTGPCGYHLVSEYVNYGLITHTGRPMDKEGAHCIGQNTNSIGWCLVGNYDKDKVDDKQYEFLAKEYVRLVFPKYGRLPVERHNKYSSTACPGKNFDIDKLNFLIDRFDNVVKPKRNELTFLKEKKLILGEHKISDYVRYDELNIILERFYNNIKEGN